MRKFLKEVGNEGCEGWEGNDRRLRRNLGNSKTWERLQSRNRFLHSTTSERNYILSIRTTLHTRRI